MTENHNESHNQQGLKSLIILIFFLLSFFIKDSLSKAESRKS